MPVRAGIDQLDINAYAIAGALDAPFDYIRHSKLLTNLAHVARDPAFILHYRHTADHFPLGDPSEIRQNFVLNAGSKKRIVFVLAPIFKREHRDALFGRRWFDLALTYGGGNRQAANDNGCNYEGGACTSHAAPLRRTTLQARC